jgi:hypothetical protein
MPGKLLLKLTLPRCPANKMTPIRPVREAIDTIAKLEDVEVDELSLEGARAGIFDDYSLSCDQIFTFPESLRPAHVARPAPAATVRSADVIADDDRSSDTGLPFVEEDLSARERLVWDCCPFCESIATRFDCAEGIQSKRRFIADVRPGD